MNLMRSCFYQLRHSPILRYAPVLLIASAWISGFTTSGTTSKRAMVYVAVELGDLDKLKATLKDNPDVLATLLLVDGDWSGDGEPKV